MSRLWSEKEVEILNKLWGKVSVEEICKVLKSRTAPSVRQKAHFLGLPRMFDVEIDLEYYAKLMEVTEG